MNSATFYLVEGNTNEIAYRSACHLIYQLWAQQCNAYLYCENIEIAKSIDDLLWTFKDTSFIPHQLLATVENTNNTPIYIGSKELGSHPTQDENAILMNLTEEVPYFYKRYSRIVEIVLDDPLKKKIARNKYKIYRDSHYQLHTSKEALSF